MIELKEHNGLKLANARSIHTSLGIKFAFSTWIKSNIESALLDENKDFFRLTKQSTGGRPSTEYLLTRDSSLSIVAMSRGQKAKDVRLLLIDAYKEKKTGVSLTVDQVAALTDMVKAMTLVSIQKKAETKHYHYFNKPSEWWGYRAELLGYSKKSLIEALKKVNKKYKNTRIALMKIDPSELIRSGVIDLLISLGRDQEYAINIGEWAREIAKSNNYHLQIWDDTKPNPLGLNQNVVNERKKLI